MPKPPEPIDFTMPPPDGRRSQRPLNPRLAAEFKDPALSGANQTPQLKIDLTLPPEHYRPSDYCPVSDDVAAHVSPLTDTPLASSSGLRPQKDGEAQYGVKGTVTTSNLDLKLLGSPGRAYEMMTDHGPSSYKIKICAPK